MYMVYIMYINVTSVLSSLSITENACIIIKSALQKIYIYYS